MAGGLSSHARAVLGAEIREVRLRVDPVPGRTLERLLRGELPAVGVDVLAQPPAQRAKLTTLDDFLGEEGKRDEFEAIAVKEVLAWQIGQAMKERNISRASLAQRMKTSRSQIGRLLDPKDGNVTLATLQRAARMVGRSLRLELV